MGSATMVAEEFTCKNGKKVRIEVDCDYTARVTDENGTEIGRLEFRQIEEPGGEYLKLCWAYMDLTGNDYKHQGIGRECLKRVRDASGMEIVANDHDGHRQDDGSHLTQDAPEFVRRMQDEGLIASTTTPGNV
jgi:hypothetical protein